MDGTIAPLPELCALARKYDALVFIDDCHATGFLGRDGRGTVAHFDGLTCSGADPDVHIINSTLGKAMGGAMGGYTTSAVPEIVEMLRQKARPYLFSNSLAPGVVGAAQAAYDLVDTDEGRQLQ